MSVIGEQAIKAQAGSDPVDWEVAYRQHMPGVYNFFRYRCGDDQIAEDLTSTTFEKAWKGRHRFRKNLGKFTTWLFVIARNVAIDYLRSARLTVPLESASVGIPRRETEDLVERKAEVKRIEMLLDMLPGRERELVSMKYGAGLTNRQIAQITGLSETNVGTILHRTVGTLREAWGK